MSDRIVFSISKRTVARLAGLIGTAAGLIGLGYVAGVRAAVPPDDAALTYTGVVVDNGVPLSGAHAIAVTLFPDATSTTALCTPFSAADVSVTQGRFAVRLDATCVTAMHANASAFVEVKVDNAIVGNRTPIGAVPFAEEASHALTASGVTNGAVGPAGLTGGVLHSMRRDSSNCVLNGATTDCACAAGEVAIGGGAFMPGDPSGNATGLLIESRPLASSEIPLVPGADGDQTWRMTCAAAAAPNALTRCAGTFVVCAASAP